MYKRQDNDYWDAVRGYVHTTVTDSNRTLGYRTDDDAVPPTEWSGTEPGYYMFKWVPNIVLVIEGMKEPVTILPVSAGGFESGQWNGEVVVFNEAQEMFLSANDGIGHSGKSNRFEVVDLKPRKPEEPEPNDGATDVPISKVLSWTYTGDDSSQVSYNVYLGTVYPPTGLVCVDSEMLWFDPTLRCSQIYYWQVVASNSYGSTFSPVWSFITESLDGDFDLNCIVDSYDLRVLVDYWLQAEEMADIASDYEDNLVDFLDFAVFSENWLYELAE